MQDLATRMKLFTPGQFTWPDLNSTARCSACRFADASDTPRGKVRCALVKARLKTKGVAFVASEARACTQFDKAGVPL